MNQIGKGILVILVTLGLWAVACNAKAGTEKELRELLDNKQVVYNGVCWFDSKGQLTFKHQDHKVVKRCVVGMALPDTTKHYIMLINEQGAYELLLWDDTAKKQTRLWFKGTEV